MKKISNSEQFQALKNLAETPLWAIGDLDILNMPLVSVIGSREVSSYGIALTMKCVKILLSHNIGVVSGLALGVDSVAHNYTLDHGGKTVAVLGTPIDQCYPPGNFALLDAIKHYGLVLSQFAQGTAVQKGNFPRRNMTMAELSGITLVVEAGATSGTRHQVLHALAKGKRVGFPLSLVRREVPWITKVLSEPNVFVISEPHDIEKQLMEVFQL